MHIPCYSMVQSREKLRLVLIRSLFLRDIELDFLF
jgi:hypothetical protein